MKFTFEERRELESGCWNFIVDFTYWIAKRDIQEAINTLETQISVLKSEKP